MAGGALTAHPFVRPIDHPFVPTGEKVRPSRADAVKAGRPAATAGLAFSAVSPAAASDGADVVDKFLIGVRCIMLEPGVLTRKEADRGPG